MKTRSLPLIAFLSLATFLCLKSWSRADEGAAAPAPAPEIKNAIAVVQPLGDNKVGGIVRFTLDDKGLHVVADLTGLTPGQHGFHIHEYGDCSSSDGQSAGGHYNPGHEHHGGPEGEHHHAGDLGNIEADADGKGHLDIVVAGISISGVNPILGRSVVVHAKPDDLKSDPSGNSGARIGCGIIGIAKP